MTNAFGRNTTSALKRRSVLLAGAAAAGSIDALFYA